MGKIGYFLISIALMGLLVGCKGNNVERINQVEGSDKGMDETVKAEETIEAEEATKVDNTTEMEKTTVVDNTSDGQGDDNTSIEPIEAVDYEAMIARSLINMGNNERMLRAIDKAKAGEDVTIAYLGGSITQGGNSSPQETSCYAYLSYMKFKEKFGGDNVHYVNSGVAGTPSTFGLIRVDKDILNYQPDVVIVEFAVNDEGKPFNQYIYESLIRRLLKSDTQPAIILMFTVFEQGHNSQAHMAKVGTYYELPMISVKDAIFPEIKAGRLDFKKDYGKDGLHPDNEGHKMIADFFGYYFDQVVLMSPDKGYDVKEASLFEKSYETLWNVNFEGKETMSIEGFKKQAINCFTYKEGWVKDQEGKGEFIFNLTFSELIIAHQQFAKNTYGTMEIYVDDQKVGEIEGSKEGAWNNVIVTPFANPFDDGKSHQVTLKMTEEDKDFVLLEIGVKP